jgi:protein TonB
MSGRLRKVGLAGLVLIVHLGGLAMLGWISPARFVPVLETPIQVALLREEAPSPPAAAPTPPPPVELPVQATPPRVQPPPPKPRPQPVAKPAPAKLTPAKPAEPVPTTTAESAVATEAPAPTAPAPAAAVSAPAATSTAAPVTAGRLDAHCLNNPKPVYPPLSRRMREEGTVTLRVVITSAGQPTQIEVARSSGFDRLDRAAELAVDRWRCVAARQGGHPVEARVLMPIDFKLEN